MLEEEFVGTRSWFIGLTDFGHEGRYQKYSVVESIPDFKITIQVDLASLQ